MFTFIAAIPITVIHRNHMKPATIITTETSWGFTVKI